MLTFARASLIVATALAAGTLPTPVIAGTTAPISITPAKRTVSVVVGVPVVTTVTVRNRTPTARAHVVVRIVPVGGVVAGILPRRQRSVVIARLGPRASRAIRIRLVASRAGTVPVTMRATVGPRTVSARITVTARSAGTAPTGPTTTPSRLAGRAFFRTLPLGSARDVEVLAFGASGFAYHEVGGFTTPGIPVCTAATDDGAGNGCRPFADDGVTITLGGEPVTVTAAGVRVGAVSYDEVAPLAAGTRLDLRLEYIHQLGFCPGPLCAFSNSDLLVVGDGRFIMTASAMGIGTDPNLVDWTAVSADQKGTYRVDVAGTITLAFANGTVEDRFAGMFRNGVGTFDPAAGLLLGTKPYLTP